MSHSPYARSSVAARASASIAPHSPAASSREGVIHVMTHRIVDRTEVLGQLSETHEANPLLSRADEFVHPQHPRGREQAPPRTGQHPRNVRLLPRSRDFH